MHIGTFMYAWLRGELVGTDSFGNRYYRLRGRSRRARRQRRWVLYNGAPEASRVPPEWHAWLHHTVDAPLAEADTAPVWRKEHVPNLTGTSAAHRPQGHMLGRHHTEGERRYRPWRPS